MKKKDFVIKPINTLEKVANNFICEAFGCNEKSTKEIEISAGKLGKITLSVCDICLDKFK